MSDQALEPANPYRLASFAGQSAIVTGASQGLGLAVARLMKARGASELLLVGRNLDKGQAAARSLDGDRCAVEFVAADLATEDGVEAVFERAADLARLDSLAHCAAATWRGTVWNTTGAMWDAMLALNVKAPGLLITGAARLMQHHGNGGSIVLVGSVAHHGGNEVLWPYATAKHALEAMVRNAAWSLLSERIRVNLLNPGWMDTPAEDEIQRRFHGAGDDWLELASARQPFGRLLHPDEVARGICFLASGESGMMSGTSTDFDQTIPGVGDATPAPVVPHHFPWEDQ